MANISSAYGTLTLEGNWTQEDIDAFIPVLNCWNFYGEYGIQTYDRCPTVDAPQTGFRGCGRWDFSGTLESFDDWTWDWIKNPGSDRHPLSQEQYKHFLCLMEERNLSIVVKFKDREEGVGFDSDETGVFSAEEGKLVYAPFVIWEDLLRKYKGSGGNVVIPEGVAIIGWEAFSGCTSLTSVTIPKGVKKIRWGAFSGCTGLTSVTIPESVTEIGTNAFRNTPWLKSLGEFAVVNHILLAYQGNGGDVIIPAGVTEIGYEAFSGCTDLTSVTIPEGVTRIKDEAFKDCTGLTSVAIPEGVKEIDKSVFEGSSPIIVAPHIPVGGFSPKNKPGAVLGFAKMYFEGMEMDEEVRAGYLKYIKGQKKRLCPLAVEHEELLRLMLTEKMFPRKDVDVLLAECDKQNNAAAKAAVMDYINAL